MKRLLIALVAAVAVSTASAKITDTQLFETSFADFVADDLEEDGSELADHASAPSIAVPYPCADFGEKFLSLDTGETTLWRTNTAPEGNIYFDMALQFNPSLTPPELAAGDSSTKILLYQNADSNLVILAGTSAADRTAKQYETATQVAPGTWARVSVSSELGSDGYAFKVYINGNLQTVDDVSSFPSLTAATTIDKVGFSGSGALDDFVARTTDPFIQNPAATIGGEGYASLEEALEDATAESVIELGADHAAAIADLAAGTTYKIKKGEYAFGGFTVSGETVLTESTVDGVTTYAAVDGVAAVKNNDTGVEIWYATFAEAFNAAKTTGVQTYPDLKVKISGDFTPDISEDQFFNKLIFVNLSEGSVSIALKNAAGTFAMRAERYEFPSNATLTLAKSGDVYSISGGTLNIPEDVRIVLMVNPYTITTITGLTGTGTIAVPEATASGHSWAYWLAVAADQNRPFAALIRNSDWHGVIELTGGCDWDIELSKIGNANSKVRFNGFTTMMYGSGHGDVGVEIAGSGLSITGLYDSARTYTVGGAITGSGPLTLADNTGSLLLSGDTSGFTGSVTVAGSSAAVTFGAATTGNGQRIVIQSGKTATIGEGATWTAANLVLLGELTVNGTLAVNDSCIWCNNGAGVLRYANKDTLPTSKKVAGSWNSKCIIACDPGNKRFVLNNFGNANSTLEIAGDNGVFSALPSTDNTAGTAPSINPAVILTANWTVSDGWAAADKVTTFSKLSGSGNLTVNGSTSGTAAIYYTITELNDYTGTLGGNRGNFTISKVNVAEQPTNGACVVKTAIGANGSINDNVPLYVDGTDTGKTLTYDANGAEGAGLYLVASSPAGFDGGDGATFNIPDATQTALAAVLPSGKTLADVADAASGMTYAQAYALGLLNETTGDVEDLNATIEIVGGKVKVSLDATAGAAYTVTLKVYEKASLTAAWPATATQTYTLGNEGDGFTPGSATAGFYKVEVSISNK